MSKRLINSIHKRLFYKYASLVAQNKHFLWSWAAQSERDKPSGLGENHTAHWQQVYLELVLLAIDDDSGDLLIHEEQDGDQQGR